MSGIDLLLNYLTGGSAIHFFVLFWLSIYFIMIFWIFLYKFSTINKWISKEEHALELFQDGREQSAISSSVLKNCIKNNNFITKEKLEICKSRAIIKSTAGLTALSIVASTAPFIGLFGTVVSILDSFSHLGGEMKATLDVIAPVISEALVATAAGIFVAIPAYSFHLIIKRRSFMLISTIEMQIDLYLSRLDDDLE